MNSETKDNAVNMAELLVLHYHTKNVRYDLRYNIHDFALSWSPVDDSFIENDRAMGEFSEVLVAVLDDLLTTNRENMRQPVERYSADRKKMNLGAIAEANWVLVREKFLELISGSPVAEQTRDITNYHSLANEAAKEFAEAYAALKNDSRYNLEDFLSRIAIKKIDGEKTYAFLPKNSRQGGMYKPMLYRLKSEYGQDWQKAFVERLNPDVLIEFNAALEDIGKEITSKDKEDLINRIAQEGPEALSLIARLSAKAYEVLVARFGQTKFTEKDRDTLIEIEQSKGLRQFLGRCRKQLRDSESVYDWQSSLVRTASGIPETIPTEDKKLIRTIVENELIREYLPDYQTNPELTVEKLKAKLDSAEPSEKAVYESIHQHFSTMLTASQLKGIKRKLRT